MARWRDQCGRSLDLPQKPRRIISTVPSQSELLADFGLNEEVLGITGFCVHPPAWRQNKSLIGGTKDLQLDKIRALRPDLIIGNKEENIKAQIEALSEDCPVWLSDIRDVDSALAMIEQLGEILDCRSAAAEILLQIKRARADLKALKAPPLKVAYFIWQEPYMLAGPDSFISAMIEEIGWRNLAPSQAQRYPQVSPEELAQWDLDLILLSSEPYAFKAKDSLPWQGLARQVKLVDGEYFSWYGSRMAAAFRYFQRLVQSTRFLA